MWSFIWSQSQTNQKWSWYWVSKWNFRKFLEENGIVQNFAAVRIAQQNKVDKCRNHTLNIAGMGMDVGLSLSLWLKLWILHVIPIIIQ